MDIFHQHEPVLQSEDLSKRSLPIPRHRIEELTQVPGQLIKRQDNSYYGASSSNTTAIAIGVVVPVVIIFIIMLVVVRRRKSMRRVEKRHENDRFRSLDFGDETLGKKAGNKRRSLLRHGQPEMRLAGNQTASSKTKGLSLDMGLHNPYMLPPELNESRDSLRSLSRAGDDKYRATDFIPDDGSIRSPSIRDHRGDASSIFTSSSRHFDSESRTELIGTRTRTRDNSVAASTQRSMPPLKEYDTDLSPPERVYDPNSTTSVASKKAYPSIHDHKSRTIDTKETSTAPIVTTAEIQPTPPPGDIQELESTHSQQYVPDKGQENMYHNDNAISELADTTSAQYRRSEQEANAFEMEDSSRARFPPRKQSIHNTEAFGHNTQRAQSTIARVPEIQLDQSQHLPQDSQTYDEQYYDEHDEYASYASYLGYTYDVRPLPPDDPSENPEQRANRIRSFYKEYFDDSTPSSGVNSKNQQYYDGSEHFADNYHDYYGQARSRGPSVYSDGRSRAFSHGAHMQKAPPRAFSSMSGRMGPQRPPPKKKLPPPKALMTMPTPHKLKYDDFIPNAIDFAPPQVFKNQRAGTPDSMRGEMRPYSPSVRAHVPLNSSFDDLAVMPSPHLLRKSGTFTNLDFAPPRRFGAGSTAGSDAGSIRSNRTGISQMRNHNIQAGAYRVSRIPREFASTKDDMYAQLKPKWDMRGDNSTGIGSIQVR